MKSIQDSSYEFTLTVALMNNNASAMNLYMKCWSAISIYGTNLYSSGVMIIAGAIAKFQLTVMQGNSSSYVKVLYPAGSTISQCLLSSNFLPLQFLFATGASDLRIIFYILKVYIGASSTNSVYGISICSSDTDCIEGYSCIGSQCKRNINFYSECFTGCLRCSSDVSTGGIAQTSCTACQRNTKEWNSVPTSGGCTCKYHNKFSTIY